MSFSGSELSFCTFWWHTRLTPVFHVRIFFSVNFSEFRWRIFCGIFSFYWDILVMLFFSKWHPTTNWVIKLNWYISPTTCTHSLLRLGYLLCFSSEALSVESSRGINKHGRIFYKANITNSLYVIAFPRKYSISCCYLS